MVELKKELPEIFEEFAEQRKNSFLAIKEVKEKEIPVVGVFCTYLPREIPNAMGAAVVGLCSVSDETIPDAEKDLPRNLCPLIKSSYGFAKTDKCPFFYFSDVVVGETTCDGKKKMYEFMSEFKDVFILELPHKQTEAALQYWKSEIIRFKEYLEKKFEVEITEEKLREAVRISNEGRRALKDFYELMKLDPAPVKGEDIQKMVQGSKYRFDFATTPGVVKEVIDKINKDVKKRHIKRLRKGKCTIELGLILSDVATNYERVSDHCSNIAVCLIQMQDSELEAHSYMNHLKDGEDLSFEKQVEVFAEKYNLGKEKPSK